MLITRYSQQREVLIHNNLNAEIRHCIEFLHDLTLILLFEDFPF